MRRSTLLLLGLLGAVVVAAWLAGRRARPVQEVDFRASTLVSGPEGATLVVLTYDEDAAQSYGGTAFERWAEIEQESRALQP